MAISSILILFAAQGAVAGAVAETPPVFAPAPQPPPPPPAPNTPYAQRPPLPKGDATGWVRSSDYPKQLRNGESGVTQFRLHISDKGKPVACDVMTSSGHPELDAKTCEVLMKRARFVPARSGYNRPTHGSYTARARWIAPASQ